MRALLSILCLFAGTPAQPPGGIAAADRPEAKAELRALLAEIAPADAGLGQPKGLPPELDDVIGAWMSRGAQHGPHA